MSDYHFLHTFYSTHFIMKQESILKKKGTIEFRMIPTPTDISSECGFSLLCSIKLPGVAGLDSIYRMLKNEKRIKYEKID